MRITSALIVILLVIPGIVAIDKERQDRLDFGYVLEINNIRTIPSELIPGEVANLEIEFVNRAKFPLYDIRTKILLPQEFSFFEDISKRKIPKIDPNEKVKINYRIISSPDSNEGVYKGSLNFAYLNHIATEREENDSFGLLIRSIPRLFAEIESTEIHKNKLSGEVTIEFVNNDISNIRFLTVELIEKDYEITSSSKKYIGDLDSDDFQSVDFRIKINPGTEKVILPVKVSYKDAYNKDYQEQYQLEIVIREPEKTDNRNLIIGATVVIILGVLILMFYLIKKRKKE